MKKGEFMDQDLVDEIDFMIDLLTKSGFFAVEEIIEILRSGESMSNHPNSMM